MTHRLHRAPPVSAIWAVALVTLAPACSRSHAESSPAETSPPPSPVAAAAPAAAAPDVEKTDKAELGKPAPDFTLNDIDGHPVHLADARAGGKTVVLEWFNPQCPFVNKSHIKGSLKDAPAKHIAEGVVWIGIDSAAPGKQGYDPQTIREAQKRFGVSYPILRDESGAVGRAYGATNTPHMFVIDKTGTLVYAGAIDNSPDAEGESPTDGKLVNYVDAALEALKAGRPVKTPSTKAYGCGVKYSS
ncbi:MAG: thioredoxin family protein [Polyangiaceae bacterium]|nr:thioredoxin family protein [Polyangiaceae bacterium]